MGRKVPGQHGVGGTRTGEVRVGHKAAGQLLTAWGGRDQKFMWAARYQDSSCSHGVGGTRTGEVRVGRKAAGQPLLMGWEESGRVKFR